MKKWLLLSFMIIAITAIAVVLRRNIKAIKSAENISQLELETIPVKVDKAGKRLFAETYSFPGILNPIRDLMVISQTQGTVLKISGKTGDFVRKGEELVKVDDELMQAELMVTEANFQKAKKDLERFEQMAEQDGVTRDQLEKIKLNLKNAEAGFIASRKRVRDTSIKAPFSGYINQLFTQEGMLLGPGKPVFQLVDISSFSMKIKASEDEIVHITKDMQVHVTLSSYKDLILEGKIVAITVSADMAQQYMVELEIKNALQSLKGGLMATAHFSMPDEIPVLAIAKKNIRNENGQDFIYQVMEGVAKKVNVQTGRENDLYIEITDGLSEGALIVTSGIEQIKPDQKVNIISE